jgi:hypothetical protein
MNVTTSLFDSFYINLLSPTSMKMSFFSNINTSLKTKNTNMKNSIKVLNVLTWASLILSSPAQAFSLNFDNSWEKFGDVEVVNPSKANLSTDGLVFDDTDLGANNGDFNYSGNPAASVGFVSPNLAEFLGINASKLDVGGYAYEGSAIKKTINVNAGDVLKFAWNFQTNETALATDPWRGSFIDYSFFLVDGQLNKLADINNANAKLGSIFDQETGLKPYEYKFNNTGTYTVALGVVDINDYNVSSALSLENIRVEKAYAVPEPVPEPMTMLGTGVALGFGVLLKKESSKRLKK